MALVEESGAIHLTALGRGSLRDSAWRAVITGNVVIGLRGGVHVIDSRDVTLRGEYSDDRYYGGYSQGLNLELQGSPGLTASADVIRGASWPVRGLDGDLRDSLVMESGHNWIMAPADGARIDHDISSRTGSSSSTHPSRAPGCSTATVPRSGTTLSTPVIRSRRESRSRFSPDFATPCSTSHRPSGS